MFKLIIILMLSLSLSFSEVSSDPFELDSSLDRKDSISFLIEDGEDYLKSLKKDVFETTIEFRQRIEEEKKKIQNNILNKIKDKIDIDGSGTASMIKYDADNSLMTFDLNWLAFNDTFLKKLPNKAFLEINGKDAKNIFKKVRRHKFYIELIYKNNKLVIDKTYILYQDKILSLFFKKINSSLSSPSLNKENLIPLTIKVTQKNAKIMITNIKPKYYDGIELEEGKYKILITKRGYLNLRKSISLGKKNVFHFSLKKLRTKRRIRYVPVSRDINRGTHHRRGNNGWE